MSRPPGRDGRDWVVWLDLIACLVGFGAAVLVERSWKGPLLSYRLEMCFLSAFIAWLVMVFPENQWNKGIRLWVDGFLAIMGTNLLVQCGLTYVFKTRAASWFLITAGSAFSILLISLVRFCTRSEAGKRGGILLVGADRLTDSQAALLPDKVTRILPGQPLPKVPDADPGEGGLLPESIILGTHPAGISYRDLLRLHYAGVEIEGAPQAYERVQQRVAWEYLQPSDLLFFLNPNTSPAMQAFQAAYKNLLGLTLRVVFAPLLILTSLLIVVFTGGPALEHVECLGFRCIPFQMFRFRVYRSDGMLSRIGRLIERLRLTNLPQLINVMRGEMTLFGPAPVRMVFAHRLCELLPAYTYRFTVKPGMFGWSDAILDRANELTDEVSLLELDLYYVKQESPSLDLDILVRMLLRRRSSARPEAAVVAGVARHS